MAPELDLVEEGDQITHTIELNKEIDKEEHLDVFHVDPNYLENEETWRKIKMTILGEDESSSEDEEEEEDEDEEDEEDEDQPFGMYAGCLCSECGGMFSVDVNADEDQLFIGPHCGKRVKAIQMNCQNVPVAQSSGEDDE